MNLFIKWGTLIFYLSTSVEGQSFKYKKNISFKLAHLKVLYIHGHIN